MPLVGIGVDIWIASRGGGTPLPPGQAYFFSRGQANVSFVGDFQQTVGAVLNAVGAATAAFIGSSTGGGGGGFTPSYQFNDARNSMYVATAGF